MGKLRISDTKLKAMIRRRHDQTHFEHIYEPIRILTKGNVDKYSPDNVDEINILKIV